MSAPTPRRWIEVCKLGDIPKLGSRVVAGPNGNIAIFRTAKDRLFALDDRCPHKGGPLSQGIVHGTHVACPLHNWQIALDTGAAAAPDTGCTRRHPVKAEGNRVWLWLDLRPVFVPFAVSVELAAAAA
jgi:nitrite reductase (NADH) small subunit